MNNSDRTNRKMKSLKFVLGQEATRICHADKLHNVGIARWKGTLFKLPVAQIAQHCLCMQTELFSNFHNLPRSAETTRYNHLKASTREPSTAGAEMVSSSPCNIIQPTSHVEMIREYFDVSRSTAYRIMEKDNHLRNCDVHVLARNMNTLQENCVDTAEVRNHVVLLHRCPLTTEHNIAILKELGLQNLTAEHFAKFNKFFKLNVALIKRWGLLPEQYDPLEALAALQIPDQILKNLIISGSIDSLTLEELHQKLRSVFLSWRLGCSNEEISKLYRTYRLTKKSMRLQQKVLDQLIHEWNFDIPKICQNGYLLNCSPVNIALIDSKVQNIVGIDVREYSSLTPRILTIPYHHLLQVSHILSKLPVSQASVKALPRICTLHPDTLKDRINHLQQNPEFSALQSHPRMLRLIYYHKKIVSRLDLLQQVKKFSVVPSLNKLSGTREAFNKYMTVGDLRQTRRDIVMCLSQHLSVEPTVIRKCLHFNCWGPQTTVINVQRNLSVLREVGFTADQLLSGLDAVLYPPDLVLDQLTQLPQRPQVQPFSRFKSKVNVLQHLIYFMEKNSSLTSMG